MPVILTADPVYMLKRVLLYSGLSMTKGAFHVPTVLPIMGSMMPIVAWVNALVELIVTVPAMAVELAVEVRCVAVVNDTASMHFTIVTPIRRLSTTSFELCVILPAKEVVAEFLKYHCSTTTAPNGFSMYSLAANCIALPAK